MKIRSYKGKELGSIYEAIHKDLGPEAVVVKAESSGRGMFGGGAHELIAVVDDSAGDSHMLKNVAKADEILKEMAGQRSRQKELERLMRGLRDEVTALVEKREVPQMIPHLQQMGGSSWDQRFSGKVALKYPEVISDTFAEGAVEKVMEFINTSKPLIKRAATGPCVVVLTGPTGSGKTTTMAKLAAEWCLTRHMKVGLITADTYRVAAVEQTREYAGLLGLELKVVYSSEEMGRAVEYFHDRDVVLVDTPGKSHLDAAALGGMKGILEGLGRIINLVLVPATTRNIDAVQIIESYSDMSSTNFIIVTKIDETREFSLFTTLTSCCEWPLAYITDGQRVPSDMREADSREIAALVLRGGLSERTVRNDYY